MQVFLTFDIGTSAMKTALVDGSGAVLAIDTAECTFATPRPGWVEADPESYWQAVVSGARRVLEASEIDPSSIGAIGFSSQGQTFIPINASGAPLHDAVLWLDERADGIAQDWESKWLSRGKFRKVTGYPFIDPRLTVFKVAWFSRNQPDMRGAWKLLTLPDYLIFRMTGETVTDCTMAQTTGLYSLVSGLWDSDLVNAAGLNSRQLPNVTEPGTVAGKLSADAASELGLSSGVPVCVGANDQLCGAVGAANVRHGTVSETTGSALAVVATTDDLLDDPAIFVGRHPVPDTFFAMGTAASAGLVLRWLRDLCSDDVPYEDLLADVADIPVGSEGITALPHFCGSGPPNYRADDRGAFVGLTLGHTRSHLARSIMESCCCVLRELVEVLSGDGAPPEVVRCLGGAARSDVWLQMKADMLGTRVERPACAEAASLGAAMLAAVGTGAYGSIREASEAWYRPGVAFEPCAARTAEYEAVYKRYRDMCKRLYLM